MDPAIVNIALILDHPSLYMGGPSQQSLRRAEKIVRWLEHAGLIEDRGPVECGENEHN